MIRTAYWRGFVRASVAAIFCTVSMFGAPALGAELEVDEELEELTEVQVTGTRIQNPNVTSANPVTSITGDEMRSLGMVNVADALLMLVPQNISTWQPGLTGDIQTSTAGEMGNIGFGQGGSNELDRGSFFIGNTIANLRGMDPMYGSRTLTLIDGRRSVSTSSQADVVDMNIIPSNLLQRMDVVTGGASATYGSGAMAGVVNLVLNNRMSGVNVDLTYGVNEAGDGASPSVSISGGRSFFGGRGHGLFGAEWQETKAIRDCAAARDWCAESRAMFSNSAGSLSDPTGILVPLDGYGDVDGDGVLDYPARFQMENVRFSQFSPYGVIYENNTSQDLASPAPTSGFRFTADGTGVEPFAYGFRGSGSSSSVMNGDGPLVTSGTTLRPQSERRTLFTNFEFNFTERTTGYFQGRYAETDNNNRNRYTTGTTCVRFDAPGVAAMRGGSKKAEDGPRIVYFGRGTIAADQFVIAAPPYDVPALDFERDPLWDNQNFRTFIGVNAAPLSSGITNRSAAAPYAIPAQPNPVGTDNATVIPNYAFSDKVVPGSARWVLVKSPAPSQSRYWLLESIELNEDFEDPGLPAVLPPLGRNSYAFLNQLSPEALNQVQAAFNRSPSAGAGNASAQALWGANPCAGFTAIRKVWNPQVQQFTTQKTDTWSTTAGVRGRFGEDWRWETYYQYGETNSLSRQYNGATNLSFNLAMDAVLDDRELVDGMPNPNYGRPVCRITRDGLPQLDTNGLPMSDTAGLAALAADCKPLNVFGDGRGVTWDGLNMTQAELEEMQRDALRFAFKDSASDGYTNRQQLSLTTSGTIWEGWGAGPLTGAFGVELSQDKVDNAGTRGSFYLRSDLTSWNDSFGGKTRSTEGYSEFNMPLLSGLEGINLLSLNLAGRYTSYYNKGGEGTTGESATQNTFNWKVQTVFEPFDFIRFRLTRSRDLRAAGYRELFLNQPTLPDQTSARNWWRERTEISDENQNERFGYVRVGNADLKPEKSDTLTLGLVLSPGGWAQGMRLSADYFDIRVKDGIYTPFAFSSAANVIEACWRGSGNTDVVDDPAYGMDFPPNMDVDACRDITFHTRPDGTRDLTDIVYVNASRPENGLPYQRRGIDLSWNYTFQLNRAFERLPGAMSLMVRASRALEASGLQQVQVLPCELIGGSGIPQDVGNVARCTDDYIRVNMVGQIRSNVYIPGVSPSPKWTGNITSSYRVNNLSASLSARYIGAAYLDKQWSDDPSSPIYQNEFGEFLNGSVDNNWVKPYFNFALNGSYDLQVGNMKQFQVFGSINNLFDKTPPFTGGGISGASAGYHDTMGRSYRMGVRMRF